MELEQILSELTAAAKEKKEHSEEKHGFIRFTGAEVKRMGKDLREAVRKNGNVAHIIRRANGYEIRTFASKRVFVFANTITAAKEKFILQV